MEAAETSHILRSATPRSLVIMDELGRGTATFDGVALAVGVVKHLLRTRALTLFSTHYHSLVDDFRERTGVCHAHMSYAVDGAAAGGLAAPADVAAEARVVFLYRLMPGATRHSFGVNVASMAGVPADVIRAAVRVSGRMSAGVALARQEVWLRRVAAVLQRLRRGEEQAAAYEDLLALWREASFVSFGSGW